MEGRRVGRQSVDNSEGVRFFRPDGNDCSSIKDVFALKFDCWQQGREHLITRKRVNAVEGFNPSINQIVEGMCWCVEEKVFLVWR